MSYILKKKNNFKYPVVTMGTFDGVHLGHQELIRRLVKIARDNSGEAVIITYYHHPLETIHKKTFPYLLTERDKKEELLKSIGVNEVLYLKFTSDLAAMKPLDFLQKIIMEEMHSRELVVGYDTHFGRNRVGNVEFLRDCAARFNYRVNLVPPFKLNNQIVSSSLIRDLIREGNMLKAKNHLGRYYSISGNVIKGHKLGRDLGYPTINLSPHDSNKLIPAIGVYACKIKIDKRDWIGVTNIGYSPTLKMDRIKQVETHIIDFSGDLYDNKVEIFFYQRLRDEFYFRSKDELIKAISRDIRSTRRIFEI